MKNALIIFIKNPVEGKVKTRIARTMGNERALEIYNELTNITNKNALSLMSLPPPITRGREGVKIYVFYSDFVDVNDIWSNSAFDKQLQKGKDLGERMYNAFDFVLKTHASACIIGSDCPTLSVEIMQEAFRQLTDFDCVLGPSTDGGYYLLGIKKGRKNGEYLNKMTHNLFDDMVWSTADVLPNTLKRMKENNQTVFLLPELTDIDEEKDWLIFQKNIME